MIDIINPMIKKFLPFAKERMGFDDPPRLFLRGDNENANDPLGKTAYYDPAKKSITLYITQRHPKDVMRSLSHELVHHTQNCRGEFDEVGNMGDGYAQNDEHLREMEREAYEVGNMCFRDWEDSIKSTIYFEHLQKGENKMSTKDWKNNEIGTLISEAWGFDFKLDNLNEERTGSGVGHGPGDDDPDVGERESAGKETSKRMDKDDDLEEAKKGGKDWHASGKKAGQKGADDKDTDYSGHGMRKGDESDTHKGEKDDTTKKDDELKHSGSGRGEKKGDKAYVNEDSGEDEGHHYDDNRMSDDEHIKAIEHHLAALRHDKDYDDDHIDERTRKDSPDRVAGRDAGGRRVKPLEEEEIEEIRGVSTPTQQRRTPHKRGTVPEDEEENEKDKDKDIAAEGMSKYTKAQVREALKRTITVLKERGKI